MKAAERNQEIAKAYKDGGSLRDVGAAFGISHERVRQVLTELGEPLRPHGARTEQQRAKGRAIAAQRRAERPPHEIKPEMQRAVALVREGFSFGAAAKLVGEGLTRSAVAGACHRAGVRAVVNSRTVRSL